MIASNKAAIKFFNVKFDLKGEKTLTQDCQNQSIW